MLGEWIKHKIREQERRERQDTWDRHYRHLCTMPANTFAAIYADLFENDDFVDVLFNGELYEDTAIYYASLARVEGYEVLV